MRGYSIGEAARLLGVTEVALYKAIQTGRLQTFQDHGRMRIAPDELVRYAIQNNHRPGFVLRKVREDTGADVFTLFTWILLGLGLGWLLAELFRPREERQGGEK